MSGLDLLEAEELVSETVKEPAKRWRQKWFARRELIIGTESRGPGVFWSHLSHATQEEADTYAHGFMVHFPDLVELGDLSYLGAFQVGEP